MCLLEHIKGLVGLINFEVKLAFKPTLNGLICLKVIVNRLNPLLK